jgi:hypothetical protein
MAARRRRTEHVIVEHLWSRAGANGGNRWQMRQARKRLKQADPQPVGNPRQRFKTAW